jgi:hypothetical protein
LEISMTFHLKIEEKRAFTHLYPTLLAPLGRRLSRIDHFTISLRPERQQEVALVCDTGGADFGRCPG